MFLVIFAIVGQFYLKVNYRESFEDKKHISMSNALEGMGKTEDGWLYHVMENKEAVIIGLEGAEKSITVPEQVDGYIVTEITDSAFMYMDITEAKISSTVKKIGNWAFAGCTSLTHVIVPESVTEIGEFSFQDCNEKIVLSVRKDSFAMKYAKEYGLTYECY